MLGGWEWVIFTIIMLAGLVVIVAGVVVLIAWSVSRARSASRPSLPTAGASLPLEARLAEVGRLLESGQINQDEYQAMRTQILGIDRR